MNKKILLFDLGGVLVDLGDPVAAIGLDMSNEEFWAIWLASPLVRAYETGRLTSAEFVTQFGAELGFTDAAEFDRLIRSWQLPMFDESEKFLVALFSELEVALLSNINEIHWQCVKSQTEIFSNFSKLFLSYETGNRKPDVAAYQDVIDHFDCDPGDIIFLDDTAHNVAAAQSLGMRSKQTTGHAEVRQAVDEFFG
ncbi:MAG: HAD family hydrolase [Woeseiaceae bacterium]